MDLVHSVQIPWIRAFRVMIGTSNSPAGHQGHDLTQLGYIAGLYRPESNHVQPRVGDPSRCTYNISRYKGQAVDSPGFDFYRQITPAAPTTEARETSGYAIWYTNRCKTLFMKVLYV